MQRRLTCRMPSITIVMNSKSGELKSERGLVLSLKAGDMEAYRLLFSRFYPKFLHFAETLSGGGYR